MTEPDALEGFEDLIDSLARAVPEHGLAVFAGAGLSMPKPSSLPSWLQMNSAFLESLGLRLSSHSQETEGIQLGEFLIQRRDDGDGAIGPDLQAQIAVSECGQSYFDVFAPLDVDSWNTGHAAIAALAGQGSVRAIVTTNFDRLVEHALDAVGVQYRVFKDLDGFEALENTISNEADHALPVIKAHGSIEEPATMVDTLNQRTLGRPRALEASIATLVSRHVTVIAGFSGADLARRPNYLGLAEGAKGSPLMVVVSHGGGRELTTLAASAADGRGHLVHGQLPEAMEILAARLAPDSELPNAPWDAEMEFPGSRHSNVALGLWEWAKTLDPLSAATIMASILQAAGADRKATALLQRAAEPIQRADERQDGAFVRHAQLLGSLLVEQGLLGPNGEPFNEEEQTPEDSRALTLVTRSAAQPGHGNAYALAARALYYLGQPRRAERFLELASSNVSNLDDETRADSLLTTAYVARLLRRWDIGQEAAAAAYDIAADLGDLVLVARSCCEKARFLTRAKHLEAAQDLVSEAWQAASPLVMKRFEADILATQGALNIACENWQFAFDDFAQASTKHIVLGRVPSFIESSLGALWAGLRVDREWVDENLDGVKKFVRFVPGLKVNYWEWFALAMEYLGDTGKAQRAAIAMERAASRSDNEWAASQSKELLSKLDRRQRRAQTGEWMESESWLPV